MALLLVVLACGCRPRVRHDPRQESSARDAAAERDAAEGPLAMRDAAPGDAPAPPFESWAGVTERRGGVTVDRSLRAPWLASEVCEDERLLPGDVVRVGPAGEVTVTLRPSGTLTLKGEGALEVPGYVGASMVLVHGVVTASASIETGDAVRVDTPGGRFIVSSGSAVLAVADDGSTAVGAEAGAVTAWPSPTAPPERSVRLSAAEIARRRASAGAHPILLDVDLPALAAESVRAVSSRPVPPRATLAWDATADPLRETPATLVGAAVAARAPRAALERWFARRRQMFARPDAHLVAVERLGRAGAGDVADVRVAVARLRMGAVAMTASERSELLARISLALGRLTARAHRGRALASRGGDVTALVQVAPAEDLLEVARGVAPFPAGGSGDL